jgi:hypothetical protein
VPRRPIALLLPSVAFVAIAIGCGEEPPPAAPNRTLQGIGPGIPEAVTDCNSAPCLCAEYPTAYEASVPTYHPTDYPGDGSRLVTIQAPGPGLVHVWPATACGDSMASYAVRIGCPICLNLGRDTEPEMLNRTYSIWPSAPANEVIFHARTGLDYWAHQDDHAPVYISGGATGVRIE